MALAPTFVSQGDFVPSLRLWCENRHRTARQGPGPWCAPPSFASQLLSVGGGPRFGGPCGILSLQTVLGPAEPFCEAPGLWCEAGPVSKGPVP